MSTVAISYKSLNNAASEAVDVAKKMETYANAVERSVCKKLDRYEGSWTENLRTAYSSASSKVEELREEAAEYRSYAEELRELKTQCETVDKAVKSKVSSLTATFKEAHGISNNVVVNSISYLLTSIGNSSAGGRWLNSAEDAFDADKEYIKQCIEDWYDYGGGKDAIKGVLTGLLELAVGVATACAAVATLVAGALTGWGLIVAIAALVTGVVTSLNGLTNFCNEIQAYAYTQGEDPATGKRKSGLDTLTDTIRSESDSEGWHIFSDLLDIVNTVCTAITAVDALGKLGSNLIKWASEGSMTSIKDLFSKTGLSAIGKKFKELGESFKSFDIKDFKDLLKITISEWDNNLMGEFKNFDTMKDAFSTWKNIFKIPLDLLKDGIVQTLGHDLLLPALTMLPLDGDDATFSDLEGLVGKSINVFSGTENILDGFFGADKSIVPTNLSSQVVEKLCTDSEISVGIPKTTIPNISMPILRAA